MATNKINWISILQGWAMFLVVLGHCSIWTENKWCMDFCYGVHMPLFMFISGGLFYMTRLKKDWQWKDVAIDKLKRLGIPYVFFITFAYGLKVALANKVKHGVSLSLPDFLEGFVYPMNSGMKEMWFVAALLLIMFAFPIYKKTIYKRNICLLVLMVAMLMPCIFNSYIGGGLFNWQGAIRYFVFFYAGMLFFKFDLVNRLNGISGGLILTLLYIGICCYRKELTVIVAFVGIGGFIWLSKYFSMKYPKLLGSFRDYSFQIFLLGIYPQMFVELFLMKKFTADWMQPILLIVSVLLGLYVPVLISKMGHRIDNKYVNMILGLK